MEKNQLVLFQTLTVAFIERVSSEVLATLEASNDMSDALSPQSPESSPILDKPVPINAPSHEPIGLP